MACRGEQTEASLEVRGNINDDHQHRRRRPPDPRFARLQPVSQPAASLPLELDLFHLTVCLAARELFY